MKTRVKTLKIFRPFSDADRGSRLPFKNIQKNVALKRSLFTLANILTVSALQIRSGFHV